MRALFLAIPLFLILGCNGGGGYAIVEAVQGPSSIDENTSASYSVSTSDGLDICYSWAVEPSAAGTFTDQHSRATTFHAAKVTHDTKAKIEVSVVSESTGAVLKSLEILIRNTLPGGNHPPEAAAHADSTHLKPSEQVQLHDDSSDPDGNSDIVDRQWDFSYNAADGFKVDSLEQNPWHSYADEGVYLVQLSVADTDGVWDMLDAPLEITVTEPAPPVAKARANTYFQTPNEPVAFSDDGSYGSDGNIVKYEWDWNDDGIFDAEGVEASHSWSSTGDYQVQFRVTDDNGKVDTLDEPLGIRINDAWAVSWGGEDYEQSNDVVFDGSGNLVVTGEHLGPMDADPGPGTFMLSESDQAYLSSLDTKGNFLRAIGWSGSGWSSNSGVAFDGSGNVYISGTFLYSVDLDPGPGENIISGSGSEGSYLVKLDQNWSFLWAFSVPGVYQKLVEFPLHEKGYSASGADVAVDGAGDAYLLWFSDAWEYMGPGTGGDPGWSTFALQTEVNVFDPLGNLLHSESIECQGEAEALAIEADKEGNCFFSYRETQGMEHYSHSFLNTFPSPTSTSSTLHEWAQSYYQPGLGKELSPSALASNDLGQYIVTGWFEGSHDFKTFGMEDVRTASGYPDCFLNVLDSSGMVILTLTWGGTGYEGTLGTGVAVDSHNDVYVVGDFEGTVDFDPGPGVYELTAPGHSVFVVKLSSSGEFLWARAVLGSEYVCSSNIVVDDSGAVYVTGIFKGLMALSPGGGGKVLTSNGGEDAFLALIPPDGDWQG